MKVDDPVAVAAQYATEANLEARRSLYANAEGPTRATSPSTRSRRSRPACARGRWRAGELAARIATELACEVVMVDVSPCMVEAARARGVDARVGDVQELPFEDASFDCAVAAWMLFHVPEIDRGLSELTRVLGRAAARGGDERSTSPAGASGHRGSGGMGAAVHPRERRGRLGAALRIRRAP